MEILESSSPQSDTETPMKKCTDASCTSKHHYVWIPIVLAILFGFVGGLVSPMAMTWYQKRLASEGVSEKQSVALVPPTEKTALSEDTLITNLVEKNSTGVVSIVISKDVSKVRNSWNDPFQGSPFFSPFSIPQNGSQKDSGTTEKQKIGSGSGFFVSTDGLIITNKHVVADEQADYTVIVNGGKEYPAKVLARDPSNDIAILKIDGSDFPALKLGDSDKVKVGQAVVAIGNPLGEFSDSVTSGIVSGLKRNVSAGSDLGMEERLTDIIQTDAAINPGNSGGPLFNLSGEVIGMNVAMAQGAENIGFALPINSVKRTVDQVRTTGKISVPYMGVRYIILNDTIQKQNNLPYNYGALVLRGQAVTDFAVIPGSPADKVGIVENDIILEINGAKIDTEHPLSNAVSQYNVGDEITLKVSHKGVTKDIKVKLEERK